MNRIIPAVVMAAAVRAAVLAAMLWPPMFWTATAEAKSIPRPTQTDSRVRTVVYNPLQVVELAGMPGITTLLEFAGDETVLAAVVGDVENWKIEKIEARPNLILVKSILGLPYPANLSVVTNKRTYSFALTGTETLKPRDRVFRIVFRYPAAKLRQQMALANKKLQAGKRRQDQALRAKTAAALKASAQSSAMSERRMDKRPADLNFEYAFAGDSQHKPLGAFDDGTFTYFHFKGAVPAIFVVGKDGKEAVVNVRKEGKYMVVHRIAAQFTLRAGGYVTCIFNEQLRRKQVPAVPSPAVAATTGGKTGHGAN